MMQIKEASINELDLLADLFDKYRIVYNNVSDIESAKKAVAGTARSMGVEIQE